MTITIEMPVEEESAIMQKAAYEGLSIEEYTRRALREKAAPSVAPEILPHIQKDREPTREEVKARVRAGYYIVSPEVSSDRLIAERREEARREAEQEAARA